MKKIVTCLFILVVTFLLGLNLYSYSPEGIAEREVLDLMNEFHDAQINKNVEKLKHIISDNIQTFRNNYHTNATKENILSNIEQVELESINTYFIFTSGTDRKVKVSFYTEMKFFSDNESPAIHHGKYIYTFEKQNSLWQLTSLNLEN